MKFVSCKFNIDTACVELRCADGQMVSIYTPAVEDEYAENMYQRSELDWLIYNAPAAYADLVLNGDPETYLKVVTEYKPLDSRRTASTGTHGAGTGGLLHFIDQCKHNSLLVCAQLRPAFQQLPLGLGQRNRCIPLRE